MTCFESDSHDRDKNDTILEIIKRQKNPQNILKIINE